MEEKDNYFMEKAYNLAKKAYALKEVPVGAVVVLDNEIIGTGINRRETTNNPLAHAEIEAIKNASENIKSWRLLNSTIYVTLEPCAMCAGAIINARIARVVIGAKDFKRGCCGTVEDITNNSNFNHKSKVDFGLMEKECSEILSLFFREIRDKKKYLK